MITIKKADGTFAKVSLSEFKKIQSRSSVIASHSEAIQSVGSVNHGIATSLAAPRNDTVKPVHHAPAHHQTARHAVQHHPVHIKEERKQHHPASHHSKPPVSAMASPGKLSRIDAGSLLEEKIPAKGHGVLFNPKREKQVEMVISKLGFNVAPDLFGRLKSLVLARLKDIKSEDEARELLSRSVKNGGLGLTEPQVEKVLQSCREAGEMEHGWEIDAPSLKGDRQNMAVMV